ncbi:hypothetical protein IMZ48_27080 [Candidatus Bathyarchaeota archaeon]|nr:hypothetical protein [Candidatus Bathyarchaeota archaeon]
MVFPTATISSSTNIRNISPYRGPSQSSQALARQGNPQASSTTRVLPKHRKSKTLPGVTALAAAENGENPHHDSRTHQGFSNSSGPGASNKEARHEGPTYSSRSAQPDSLHYRPATKNLQVTKCREEHDRRGT